MEMDMSGRRPAHCRAQVETTAAPGLAHGASRQGAASTTCCPWQPDGRLGGPRHQLVPAPPASDVHSAGHLP
eukprot:1946041-Heterocapsa_arctica.AAC.1